MPQCHAEIRLKKLGFKRLFILDQERLEKLGGALEEQRIREQRKRPNTKLLSWT